MAGRIPYHKYTKPLNERDKQARKYRGTEEAIIITMGLSDIYNPKEGHSSVDHHRF
jgi:hypothetical protein